MKLLSEIIGPRAERTLGKLLDRDQGIKKDSTGKIVSQNMPDPASRENLQRRLSRVFDNPTNREAIFRPSKMGPDGRHAATILAQHMDTRRETQRAVADTMQKYDPTNERTPLIKGRVATNDAVVNNWKNNPEKYAKYGSTENEVFKNVRPDRQEFKNPKTVPKSPEAAMDLEKKYGNDLLVKSIKDAGPVAAQQPSHAKTFSDLPSSPKPKSVLDTIKTTAAEYAPTVSKISSTVGRVAGPIAGAAGAADTSKDIAFSTKTTRDVGHELYKNPVMKTVSDTMLSAREKLGIPSTAPEEFQRKSQPKTP